MNFTTPAHSDPQRPNSQSNKSNNQSNNQSNFPTSTSPTTGSQRSDKSGYKSDPQRQGMTCEANDQMTTQTFISRQMITMSRSSQPVPNLQHFQQQSNQFQHYQQLQQVQQIQQFSTMYQTTIPTIPTFPTPAIPIQIRIIPFLQSAPNPSTFPTIPIISTIPTNFNFDSNNSNNPQLLQNSQLPSPMPMPTQTPDFRLRQRDT